MARRQRKAGTARPKPLPEPSEPSNIDLNTFTTQLKADPNKGSFLDLAPEMRNAIYEQIAGRTPARLHRSPYRPLGSTSALLRVNKQVRNEYQGVLLSTADIRATVKDLNFAHIVHFLNHLPDQQLKTLSTATAPKQRTITIHLQFTQQFDEDKALQTLLRWARRAAKPTKKGANIDFRYTSEKKKATYNSVCDTLMSCRDEWRNIYRNAKNERSKEEFGKILQAVPVLLL